MWCTKEQAVYFCHETIQDRCSGLVSGLGTKSDSNTRILRLLQLNQWEQGKEQAWRRLAPSEWLRM